MKRILSLCIAVMLVVGSMALVNAEETAPVPQAPPEPPKTAKNVGDMVPEWTGDVMGEGGKVTGSGLKGKTYALLFVNSACSACRAEMYDLNQLDFTGNLEFMVVSLDANPERASNIYKKRFGIKFPILDDSNQEISSMFGFYFSPAAVIVDKDGKVSQQFAGYGPAVKADVLSAFKKFAN